MIPIWPLGVFFMSFSYRPFVSAPLVGLAFGLAALTVAALVLVGVLAQNRRG